MGYANYFTGLVAARYLRYRNKCPLILRTLLPFVRRRSICVRLHARYLTASPSAGMLGEETNGTNGEKAAAGRRVKADPPACKVRV